jgi:hypothetical protein
MEESRGVERHHLHWASRGTSTVLLPVPQLLSQFRPFPSGAAPRNRMIAGATATRNMLRHASIGSATLTSSAPRMPRQIISWFSDPSVPRTLVGATCARQAQGRGGAARAETRPTTAAGR